MSSSAGHSYLALRQRQVINPQSVALMLDSELAVLLCQYPFEQDQGLKIPLLAEALTRLWLYKSRCPQDIQVQLNRICPEPSRQAMASEDNPFSNNETDTESIITQAIAMARLRIADFLDCDGMIAVAAKDEAIAIPFVLEPGTATPGSIVDRTGKTITHWADKQAVFHHCLDLAPPRVTLCCKCTEYETLRLQGGSFALSILVAWKRKSGEISEYPPTNILFTGGLTADGHLEAVDSLQAKAALAQRLGVSLFVLPAPGTNTAQDTLVLQSGITTQEIIDRIQTELDARDIGKLSPKKANEHIKRLQRDIHFGNTTFSAALKRTDRYERVFNQTPSSDYSSQGKLRAHILRGSIANHSGDPHDARRHLERAAEIGMQFHKTILYVDTLASNIVTLTDLGLTQEAEQAGRELRDWVEHELKADPDTYIKARMIAHGTYGGQPLLHQALAGEIPAEAARKHLEKALQYAREIEERKEIAFDLAQLCLWYALFTPEIANQTINTTEQELFRMGADGQTSLAFARCYRFLAAYRCHLLSKPFDTADIKTWPLPSPAVEHGWVLALTRKYRGTILAANGEFKLALQDFHESYGFFQSVQGSLLRFIGATVALQAGESLFFPEHIAARRFTDLAHKEFLILNGLLFGIHQDKGWIAKTQGVIDGIPSDAIPSPQRFYRY